MVHSPPVGVSWAWSSLPGRVVPVGVVDYAAVDRNDLPVNRAFERFVQPGAAFPAGAQLRVGERHRFVGLVVGGRGGEAIGEAAGGHVAIGIVFGGEEAGGGVFEFDRQAGGRVVGQRLGAFGVFAGDGAAVEVVGRFRDVAVGVFVFGDAAEGVVGGRRRLGIEAFAFFFADEVLNRRRAGSRAVFGFGLWDFLAPPSILLVTVRPASS